jgi:hypothetical protein
MVLIFLSGVLACSRKSGEHYLIPQDADFVLAANMQQMILKSFSLKNLLNLNTFLKKRSAEEEAWAERVQHSGVDWMGTIYLFGKLLTESVAPYPSSDSLPNREITIVLPLKDAAQFESFLKGERGRLEGEMGGLKFFTGDSLVVGWNQSTAFVTTKGLSTTENLKRKIIELQDLPASKALAENNAYFNDLKDKSFDILFWADISKAGSTHPLVPTSAVKDNYLGAVLNFGKGEAVFDGNFVTQNESFGKYDNLMNKKVDQDLVNQVPIAAPLSCFALKLNTGTVKKMLQDNQLLGGANQYVQMLGMTAEEMLDMLSGDLTVSIVKAPEPGGSLPEMYVGLGIANQNSLKKLISNFKNQGFLIDEGQHLSLSFMPDLALIPQEGQLAIATSATVRESILSGKNSLNSDAGTALKEGALSGYLDYDVYASNDRASDNKPETQLTAKYLKAIRLNAIQTSETTADAHLIIEMKDKSQNSLISLTTMGKELKALRATTPSTDSTSVQ